MANLEKKFNRMEEFAKNNPQPEFKVSPESIPSAKYEIKDGKIFLTNLEDFDQNLRLRACVFDTKNSKRLNLGKGENLSEYFFLDEAVQGIDLKGISTDDLQLLVVPITSSGQEAFKVINNTEK